MQQILSDVMVIDLTSWLAGPVCTMYLGDMGATVIKIETPGWGDDSREVGPYIKGESGYFLSVNRNKKSLTLNLKSEKGKEIFKQLMQRAMGLQKIFLRIPWRNLAWDMMYCGK